MMTYGNFFEGLQGKGDFWALPTKNFPSQKEVRMAGVLYKEDARGVLVSRQYLLTPTRFIEVQPRSEKAFAFLEGSLLWARISPKLLHTSKGIQYGFQITTHNSQTALFAASDQEYDEWVRAIEPISVLTTFQADYSLGTPIETGKVWTASEGLSLETGEKVLIKSLNKGVVVRHKKKHQEALSEIRGWRLGLSTDVRKLHRIYESEGDIHLIFLND